MTRPLTLTGQWREKSNTILSVLIKLNILFFTLKYASKLLDTHIYIISTIIHLMFQEDKMKLLFTFAATLFLITNHCFASAVEMPALPVVQSKGGEWTETFDLKGGGTAMRTPTTLIIKKGMFQSSGPTASIFNANICGIKINFHLSTDMTREEFIAALKRHGNLQTKHNYTHFRSFFTFLFVIARLVEARQSREQPRSPRRLCLLAMTARRSGLQINYHNCKA